MIPIDSDEVLRELERHKLKAHTHQLEYMEWCEKVGLDFWSHSGYIAAGERISVLDYMIKFVTDLQSKAEFHVSEAQVLPQEVTDRDWAVDWASVKTCLDKFWKGRQSHHDYSAHHDGQSEHQGTPAIRADKVFLDSHLAAPLDGDSESHR